MEKQKIVIIGAGPAGMAAALGALEKGACVLLLEHMNEAGKKLLITGNGACNFTNTEVGPKHYHGSERIIEAVLKSCSWEQLVQFFKELGIPSVTEHYRFESCGYLYPANKSAESVRDAFMIRILALGGNIEYSCSPIKIIGSRQETFKICTDRGTFCTDRIIFATGSNAAPFTGSDSSIYPVLKELGIIQKPWLPALCAIKSQDPVLEKLAGLRCDGWVKLVDEQDGSVLESPRGEVQFRRNYVSGLPVMQLSRYAAIGSKKGHRMKLVLKLETANNKDRCLPVRELTLPVSGTEGFEKCVCCSGGVDGGRIDPLSLESLDVPGIYFAGEMIDVDGDCGGFNLHFAFASGLLAGRNAAK